MTEITNITSAASGVSREIGGESSHRGFFGGTQPRGRMVALAICFVAMLALTPVLGVAGLAIALGAALITILVTQNTHRGSVLARRTKKTRWAERRRAGTDEFEPFDQDRWDQLQQTLAVANSRAGRRQAALGVARMRANPDGADGMGWLQHSSRVPGIAWHAPVGEAPYLSVVFAVSGQANGVESASAMRRAAEAWGSFLATRSAPTNLVGGVQTLTRVLPSDSALQEFWVLESLDPDAPADAIRSYEEVLRLSGRDAMVQRHFITVRWPITAAFQDAARRYGNGRDGWRGLMEQEIATTIRGLTDARIGQVEALSARRVAAVMLHQQNPSRPIDMVAETNPSRMGLCSHDEFSAHVVTDTDPASGLPAVWWHRTAAIHSEDLAVGARNQLWMLDLLIGSDIQFTRSVSFHLRLIPKGEAKAAARSDLTRDRADARSDMEKGRIVNDETAANLTAAQRRAADLGHGSPHHGAAWVGFVTISETSRSALMRASKALEEVCSTGLGVDRLDWLDSYQSAASGTTWPIGRGLAPATPSFATRVLDRLAGKADEEAIS
jgi:hypothetical protein